MVDFNWSIFSWSAAPLPERLLISISLVRSNSRYLGFTATEAFPLIVLHPSRFPLALPVASGICPATDYLFLPLRRQ
jgi:hypothetical protein